MDSTTILSWMLMICLQIQADAVSIKSSSNISPPLWIDKGSVKCGGLLQAPSGSFHSPGYPDYYPNNAHCVWRIRLRDPGQRVKIWFTDVKLEGNSCDYDAIKVFDGSSTASPLLGKVCSNNGSVFVSSGRELTVLFRSDESISDRGFLAFYSSVPPPTTAPPTPTTVSTVSSTSGHYSCGGLLSSPSGSLKTPFYPRNYPDNANCVWEIKVKNNFRVTLLFRDVEIEDGKCLSDYVEVYDGPLHASPLLGRFCYGSDRTFVSSSNLLTVFFHSNSRHNYRGFWAEYYSTPGDQNTTLQCLPDFMHAAVSMHFLESEGYSPWNVSLIDPRCKPNITSEFVVFDIPYKGCGTVREGNNNTITYSNVIKVSAPGPVITRHKNLLLNIRCKMLQNTWAQAMYVVDKNVEIDETQYGRYYVNLTFYHSEYFLRPVKTSPYHVSINQDLFLQAHLHSSDPNLVLFLDTCVASPTPHNFSTVTHDIIRNGCAQDPTYRAYDSPYKHIVRFKFRTFRFVQRRPSVYLKCEFVVCKAYDYASRCYQGCTTKYKSQSSFGEQSVTAIAGPIKLQEQKHA